ALAISLERLFSSRGEIVFSSGGSRREDAAVMRLLDRILAGLFYVLFDAGILLDAVLYGAGSADRLGAGGSGSKRLGAWRPNDVVRNRVRRGNRYRSDPGQSMGASGSGRHFQGAHAASRNVYALARPHGRSDIGFLRLSQNSPGHGGDCV